MAAVAVLFADAAIAQTGPAEARVVSVVGVPPKDGTPQPRATTVEVFVGTDGRVTKVDIVEKSGATAYDRDVQRYAAKSRYIPALNAAGVPIPGSFKLRFASLEEGEETPASKLPGSVFTRSDSIDRESNRIHRMKCKDFLWEYDLMKEIDPNGDFSHDRLFEYSFAMYVAQRQPPVEQQQVMLSIWKSLVDGAISSCRTNLSSQYWEENFAPVFDATEAPK
jgi:TonB family protein